ncbi:unnamed protein product [Acanthoscelides obtectus]|uniref:Uncharacterized protein n=1 Tax=Acanthoscelides obtectus TaxID=200917 RepID=A0A9P0JIH0_ACAOB|nr:unnamed protein product [Acanthoscelides obtectus]CAK1658065.1 hypothetical protein AOBTE_LOCUS20680 [Acanthoscelides obtectus]
MNILLSSLVVLTLAVGCFSARIPNIREYFNNGEELGRNFNHGIVDPCGCEAPKPPLPPDETPPAEVPAPEPPKVVLPPGLVIIPGFAESRNENKNRDKNNNENINKNDNHNDNGNILPGPCVNCIGNAG